MAPRESTRVAPDQFTPRQCGRFGGSGVRVRSVPRVSDALCVEQSRATLPARRSFGVKDLDVASKICAVRTWNDEANDCSEGVGGFQFPGHAESMLPSWRSCRQKACATVRRVEVPRAKRTQRLIAFDFDFTIMREHLSAMHGGAGASGVAITDDRFADLVAFRSFVKKAVALGHLVAIVSFGYREVIEKAMRHAFGDDHGIPILTPKDFGVPDGKGNLGNKNIQLKSLATIYGLSPSQIVLVDDDRKNVASAKEAGYKAVHIPRPNGLTRERLKNVADAIQLPVLAQRFPPS